MSSSDPTPAPSTGGSATRVGFWAAVLTVVVTAAFAGVGVTTPPRSGPFCQTACVPYPYVDVVQFIPRDSRMALTASIVSRICFSGSS